MILPMTTVPLPRVDWSAATDPAVAAANARTAERRGRPSVLAVVGTAGRALLARATASGSAGTVLDVAGLGAITYGAYSWAEAAGWAVGGLSALIMSAKLSA